MNLKNIFSSIEKNKNIFYNSKLENEIILFKDLTFDFDKFLVSDSLLTGFLMQMYNYIKLMEYVSGSTIRISKFKFIQTSLKKKKFFNCKFRITATSKKLINNFLVEFFFWLNENKVFSKIFNLYFDSKLSCKGRKNFFFNFTNLHFLFSFLNCTWINLLRSSIFIKINLKNQVTFDYFYKKNNILYSQLKKDNAQT